ncbi:hypothetical protein SCHPADRAFT_936426 [Schizopora paradoxa]|uniref:Uncharacterized protein n=1 Tax=Schizopora paradoxa TaxID=27342 RepID=A0A0H2S2R5_9AGAM|nr:hypothetical protein SCHPADRAFT_936426 [Schizopora paradoxa]
MDIPLEPASSKSETETHFESSRLESSRSIGGQSSETMDDFRAMVPNLVSCGDTIPLEKEGANSIESFACVEPHNHSNNGSFSLDVAPRLNSSSNNLNISTAEIFEKLKVLKNIPRARRVASLPDDILAMIFDILVNGAYIWILCDPFPKSWKVAVKLSHVSQRFRTIMLSSPRLWTTINRSSEMAATCLPRTNGLPLTIGFKLKMDTNVNQWIPDLLLSKVLPYSNLWRSLSVILEVAREHEESKEGQDLHDISATSLEELNIVCGYCDNNHTWPEWDFSRWDTPKLRRLLLFHYVPDSLPGLAYVTALQLTLLIDNPLVCKILGEVAKMNTLKEFTLNIDAAREDQESPILLKEWVFQNVNCLEINLEQHLSTDSTTPALTRALFSSMYFPNATELHIKFSGVFEALLSEEVYDMDLYNFHCNKAVSRIFRHIDQFPQVSKLEFEVETAFDASEEADAHAELYIPLLMLPCLKHVTLKSDGPTLLTEPGDEEQDEIEDLIIPPRKFGETMPSLATVTLKMLDNSVGAAWLKEYLEDLEEQGGSEDFCELVVWEDDGQGASNDLQKRRKRSYSREEALEWCATRYEDNSNTYT